MSSRDPVEALLSLAVQAQAGSDDTNPYRRKLNIAADALRDVLKAARAQNRALKNGCDVEVENCRFNFDRADAALRKVVRDG